MRKCGREEKKRKKCGGKEKEKRRECRGEEKREKKNEERKC